MRRLTLRLGEAQAGRTVHTLLRQELLLSAASVRRAKTLPDGILLDGQPVFTNQTGRAGQLLSVAVGDVAGSEQIPPVPGPLTIRYEDEDLVVVEKEGGVPVHPSPGGERIRVLESSPPSASWGSKGRATPGRAWGTRRAREVIRRKESSSPSRVAPSPQIPTRTPPAAVT